MEDKMTDLTTLTGRALDAEIAERVMGWTYQKSKHGHWKVVAPDGTLYEPMYGAAKFDAQTGEPIVDDWWCGIDLPQYSTDLSAAWPILDKISGDYRVTVAAGGTVVSVSIDDFYEHVLSETAETAPLAICRAAIALRERGR